jgi:hypothetical protein
MLIPMAGRPSRRSVLRAVSAAATLAAPWALAQPAGKTGGAGSVIVAQLVDSSANQLDVSRDFLIGSRAFWQDANSRGGVHGRRIQHLTIDTDGTLSSVRAALDSVRGNPACIVLSGSSGDPLANLLTRQLEADKLAMAHVAPWLQSRSEDQDERTFGIFASHRDQIAYAIKSLAVMGVTELGAVYANPQAWDLYHPEIDRVAAELKLRTRSWRAQDNLLGLGQGMKSDTPAILLFLGGTPELAQFTQGMEKQPRQRYLIALADVNLQTMLQMGGARSTSVIATQVVPASGSSLPVVRAYREVLGRLFDEPPTALSLAGFIAARYTFEVLNDIEGGLTRATALAAFSRRQSLDIGGFRVAYSGRQRGTGYVTQTMLTHDGRIIG